MKCDKCGSILDIERYGSDNHRGYTWMSILDILIVWHLCPINCIIRHNCLICEAQISRERSDAHLIKCLHGSKILVDRNFVKMGTIRDATKYFQTSTIFSSYPQLLIVNGLGIDWIDSNSDADSPITEIIAKKVTTMSFHCLICGLNYEAFPTKNILFAHLTTCVAILKSNKIEL